MKKSLLSLATALALAGVAPLAAAHDNHACIDASCDMVALFQATPKGRAAAAK